MVLAKETILYCKFPPIRTMIYEDYQFYSIQLPVTLRCGLVTEMKRFHRPERSIRTLALVYAVLSSQLDVPITSRSFPDFSRFFLRSPSLTSSLLLCLCGCLDLPVSTAIPSMGCMGNTYTDTDRM